MVGKPRGSCDETGSTDAMMAETKGSGGEANRSENAFPVERKHHCLLAEVLSPSLRLPTGTRRNRATPEISNFPQPRLRSEAKKAEE